MSRTIDLVRWGPVMAGLFAALATISFTTFCTNYGQKFPTGVQNPNALVPDKSGGRRSMLDKPG